MRILCSIIVICAVWAGCANTSPVEPTAPKDAKAVTPPAVSSARTPTSKPVPEVTVFGKTSTFIVDKKMTLDTVTFKHKPSNGERVTVVPRNGLGVAPLQIKSAEIVHIDEDEQPIWNVEFANIENKAYLSQGPEPQRRPEFPFDVCVLYPEVPTAKSVPLSSLHAEALPKGLFPHNVWAAIDLNEDGAADALFSEFYCKCPEIARGPKACDTCDCDYTCTQSFIKKDGAWTLIGETRPR